VGSSGICHAVTIVVLAEISGLAGALAREQEPAVTSTRRAPAR
jgi:hypothetical protein